MSGATPCDSASRRLISMCMRAVTSHDVPGAFAADGAMTSTRQPRSALPTSIEPHSSLSHSESGEISTEPGGIALSRIALAAEARFSP